MVRVAICTTIDIADQEIIKKKGYKVSELIAIGLKTRMGVPIFEKRIGVTEQELREMKTKFNIIAVKNQQLEQKIAKMGQNYEK